MRVAQTSPMKRPTGAGFAPFDCASGQAVWDNIGGAMGKDTPAWLTAARELCRANKIEIAGWGPLALVVYAKTPDRAREIAALLASLGLRPVEDPADEEAGLLTLKVQ